MRPGKDAASADDGPLQRGRGLGRRSTAGVHRPSLRWAPTSPTEAEPHTLQGWAFLGGVAGGRHVLQALGRPTGSPARCRRFRLSPHRLQALACASQVLILFFVSVDVEVT